MDIHPIDLLNDYPNNTEIRQELLDTSAEVPMGAYCLSPLILYSIVAIDATIFVLGIVGNAIACIVIACSKSMHTPTNCYLFSLSMSDLLLLITGAPHEIHEMYYPNTYYGGTIVCLLRSWAAEVTVNVSVITITAFTYERYLAICRPFVAHAMSQVSRVKKLIVIIWIAAVLISLPVAAQHRYRIRSDGTSSCEFDEKIIPYWCEATTALLFIIPVTVITIMYILIGMNLMRTSDGVGLSKSQIHGRADDSNKRTVKMLIVIVLTFILCWAPYHAQRLMAAHFNDVENDVTIFYDNMFCIVTHVSGITYLLSAVINPLIYSVMSSKFRDAFEELIFSSGKNLCRANYYGWKKSWNITKNVDVSRTNDISCNFATIYNNINARF